MAASIWEPLPPAAREELEGWRCRRNCSAPGMGWKLMMKPWLVWYILLSEFAPVVVELDRRVPGWKDS